MIDKNESKYYNQQGLVICQYCLKEFRGITKTHLSLHDMTLDEYKDRFPDAPLKKIPQDELDIRKQEEDIIQRSDWDDDNILTRDYAYLLLKQKYPTIINCYNFQKLNRDSLVLFTIIGDFGDLNRRIMFDFKNMPWNFKTPLFTDYRKSVLLSESKWRYFCFDKIDMTVIDLKNELELIS